MGWEHSGRFWQVASGCRMSFDLADWYVIRFMVDKLILSKNYRAKQNNLYAMEAAH
jgi:hypothetical protein